jgi:hypothetical protein
MKRILAKPASIRKTVVAFALETYIKINEPGRKD